MNSQYQGPSPGPMYGLIKFLAVIGLITIFGLGITLGVFLASNAY